MTRQKQLIIVFADGKPKATRNEAKLCFVNISTMRRRVSFSFATDRRIYIRRREQNGKNKQKYNKLEENRRFSTLIKTCLYASHVYRNTEIIKYFA